MILTLSILVLPVALFDRVRGGAATLLVAAASKAGGRAGASLARLLMMPLAFGTILGGYGDPPHPTDIAVGDILRQLGRQGFGLLDFASVGLPLVAAGDLALCHSCRVLVAEPILAER